MYYFFKGLEAILNFIRIKCKIIIWKLKYGKRIKIGKNLKFRKRFSINITNGGYLEIGDNNFFNNDCSINCHNKIIIGKDNLFGENIKVYDHNHIFNDKKINIKKSFKNGEINIGDRNWFGTNVVILSKATLKDYNVVAAGNIINQSYDSENIIYSKDDVRKINFK